MGLALGSQIATADEEPSMTELPTVPAEPVVAAAPVSPWFTDLYAESVFLGDAQTLTGLATLRAGRLWNDDFEVYGFGRLGGDTRTYLDKSDAVYNDNFFFFGLGLDYLGLTNGVRMIAQVGASLDLNSKIDRGGFDFRTGMVTYHEAPFNPEDAAGRWVQEIYTESLYVHRYRNFLATAQWRVFGNLRETWAPKAKAWDFGPLFTSVVSVDSKGYSYNRFVEFRAGARVRRADWWNLAFVPQYVFGSRWDEIKGAENYGELRALMTFAKAF